MASPLDFGLLEQFSGIFAMILVWILIYGILSYSKPFGARPGLYAMVGFIVSLFILFMPSLQQVIMLMVPWFAVFFIFLILLLTFYGIMGAKEDTFLKELKGNKTVSTWFLIISFTIFISALGAVFFTGGSDTAGDINVEEGTTVEGDITETGTSAAIATIFHPKVLGVIMILLIATFSITLLSGKVTPD